MKRVLCLYRVSTKGQVDKQNDIPMQRRECLAFIEQHSDWIFIGERLEKGVSGFKVSASKRDVIIEIRSMAERKEFDVLLVFMFGRLGRREDETPFLVEWFINHGIEVWSTREGQQKIESRSDKLMNYIRYWMAGGESEKTSMRVKAAHRQMIEDGIWRGGNTPFGYRLVHNGRFNKKNRALYDLEVDPSTAPIVREIFDLVIHEGYGTYRIANFLNGKYPGIYKIWTSRTILTMLRNPIYIGRMHMNDVMSEPIEALRLIQDDDFSFAQYIIHGHIQHKYKIATTEDEEPAGSVTSMTATYGATLLSGLIYCGHCGHKLIGTYCAQTKPNGKHYRPVYRCYHSSIKARHKGGQTVYSGRMIDAAVLEAVHAYFNSMNVSIDNLWRDQAKRQLRDKSKHDMAEVTAELEKYHKQEQALRQEFMDALTGDGEFDKTMLKEMLEANRAAIQAAEDRLQRLKDDRAMEEERIRALNTQYQKIKQWADVFDSLSNDEKKMILARIIKKITVRKGYIITIEFYLKQDDFSFRSEITGSESEVQVQCV